MAVYGDEETVLSVIPGVARAKDATHRHAFIQVISSTEAKSWYVPYPYEAFHAEDHSFAISVGNNHFSLDGISLHIDHEDLHVHGNVRHHETREFPVTVRSPGIMGWYAYVPFMECFHGVVSTHHLLAGDLTLNGKEIHFDGGEGYIEKDWGTSFPSKWVWMQCNSFPSKQVSCMLSIAHIPFLGRSFTGFLGFISVDGKLTRFATYTGAKIQRLLCDDRQCQVTIITKDESIEFTADLGPASHLTAPRQGSMDRMITESILGSIRLTISDKQGNRTFQETGTMSGIELSKADSLEP